MMMDTPRRRPVVAILGGGLSGAITAFHLARAIAPGAAEIVVVEPRAALGGGLAYSTDEPAHRINVPASKMTIVSAEPDHFMDWLAAARVEMSPGTLTLRGDFFPERGIFGRYVAAHLAPLLERGACAIAAPRPSRSTGPGRAGWSTSPTGRASGPISSCSP